MMTHKLYLDFEFRNSSDDKLEIVCAAWKNDDEEIQRVWLQDDKSPNYCESFLFASHMAKLSYSHTFVAYAVEAEARCLYQLWEKHDEIPCPDMEWVDLYLEYRMMTNHNHDLAYGKQFIQGREVFTKPPKPKYDQTEEDKTDFHHKPSHSMASAVYKMLGHVIDTEHKNEMRDLIISGNRFTQKNMRDVLDYCASDVKHLPDLHVALSQYLFRKLGATKKDLPRLQREIRLRGEYAARTARMTMLGYPINYDALKEFSNDTNEILRKEAEEVNRLHPEVSPFELDEKTGKFVQKAARLRGWLLNQDHKKWLKTERGANSLSLPAFEAHYSKESPNLGGAMVRYLKLKQSLNGFLPRAANSTKRNFWDFVGNDKRVRPFFGIYGAQSARSQPGSMGFIPLKSNWMRAFIQPKPGRAIVGIDYGSQEFLISALMSEDDEMIKAYESGDPYLHFAKLDGAVPQDGTKETHKHERSIYKTVVLGISYLMGSKSLAAKLTTDLGRLYTQEEAQELINAFHAAFPDFAEWQQDLIETYGNSGRFARLKLPCGWYMWQDNKNAKSVGNMPIQGFGSCIMRKAVALAQDRGLDVIYTLHDAIYVEYSNIQDIDTLYECMDEAFRFYFPEHLKKRATCRMDIFTWGPELSKNTSKTLKGREYESDKIYVDAKGKNDYLKFLKYFS